MATITSKIVKEIINFPKMTGTRIVCKQLPNTCAKHLIVQNSKLHANRKQKKKKIDKLNQERLYLSEQGETFLSGGNVPFGFIIIKKHYYLC